MKTPTTAGERDQLERFVDQAREEIATTVAGLTEEQARQRLVPSLTTPLGLITHLTFVEQAWFQVVLAGHTRAELGMPNEVDPTFIPGPDLTIASALAEYERVCAQSREIAARYELDHVAEHHRLGNVSLRWIYLHMIREINRHAGHADILQEQLLAES